MRDPHNLRVADMAMDVAVLTYGLTKRLPPEGRYGLTSPTEVRPLIDSISSTKRMLAKLSSSVRSSD